jgi:type I site-specific restriction-modification system R (restriction) subunit
VISKYQLHDDDDAEVIASSTTGKELKIDGVVFPELNDSEEILVIVDEGHRSHTKEPRENLTHALPNCAKRAFSGTRIIMGKGKRTHNIFGQYIDKYTVRESQDDESTVPILYEGRTAHGVVADGAKALVAHRPVRASARGLHSVQGYAAVEASQPDGLEDIRIIRTRR